jgi:Family of unknown function (DUF6328)
MSSSKTGARRDGGGGAKPGSSAAPKDESTEKAVEAAMREARIVTPGIQALFGFQLVAVFDERFSKLEPIDQQLHFVALVLVALSIAFIMSLPAYHRIAEQGSVSEFLLHFASWQIALAMAPLMTALCLEVYIVGHLILGTAAVPIASASVLWLIFAALWFAFPFSRRRRVNAAN